MHEEANKLGIARRVSRLREELTQYCPIELEADSVEDLPLYVFYQLNREDLSKTLTDVKDYYDRDWRALNKFQTTHMHFFSPWLIKERRSQNITAVMTHSHVSPIKILDFICSLFTKA